MLTMADLNGWMGDQESDTISNGIVSYIIMHISMLQCVNLSFSEPAWLIEKLMSTTLPLGIGQ